MILKQLNEINLIAESCPKTIENFFNSIQFSKCFTKGINFSLNQDNFTSSPEEENFLTEDFVLSM